MTDTPTEKTAAPIMAPSVLPQILPIFPLAGVVLLPRGRLPLNIFEPRYLAMVEDALAHGRMIGMIQPNTMEGDTEMPPIYNVGCAGRIASFNETDDGRFLIGLVGVCRFMVAEELPREHDFRRVKPNWEKFIADMGEAEDTPIDRARLMTILRPYFKMQGIAADWNAVQNTTDEMLISSLAMICPLAPNEKQALLEAGSLRERADLLMALLEMASMPQGGGDTEAARH